MKEKNFLLIERMIREMQLRNYSERTIGSYTSSMSKLGNYFDLSLEKITKEQFKDFLHHRIMVDKVSVSMVNQTYLHVANIQPSDITSPLDNMDI